MCGIIGIWAKNNAGKAQIKHLPATLRSLHHRGPDHQAYKLYSNCAFGHVRLSIIDTDERSNQPFVSEDERYTLVFNGEIYNYKELRELLVSEHAVSFRTSSDTEVLLQLLICKGKAGLNLLDGFFAFAFYDHILNTCLIARDRLGIKPLLYFEGGDEVVFSSELQGFKSFDLKLDLDMDALNYYFGLTYFPFEYTALRKVQKLLPGELLVLENGKLIKERFYSPENVAIYPSYKEAKEKVRSLLDTSVSNRMVADVSLGSFLSGGVDSSIIAALAMQKNKDLKTFSVGFDHPYFNETDYANEVAKHIGSEHTVFLLTKEDFKSNFNNFLKAIDEPFADSSAFAVYLLSQKTKEKVTVALSGDGADEMFGGYRKHSAEYEIRKMSGLKKNTIHFLAKILRPFKNNRSDKFGELNRKIQKLSKGISLSPKDRYWEWCSFIDTADRKKLLKNGFVKKENNTPIENWDDLNAILLADQSMVLPNDMLKKVDLMSMANGLEVRTPFLDHQLVEYVNRLPSKFKVNEKGGKQILKDAFADLLPDSVLNRSKKGFEIPIKEWLNDEITLILNGPLFNPVYLEKQDLFQVKFIEELIKDWSSPRFGDRIYLVWALIVFQYWWDRTLRSF